MTSLWDWRSWMQVLLALPVLAASVLRAQEAASQSQVFADAEQWLWEGDTERAIDRYRRAFVDAADLEERLGLVGPLVRATLLQGGGGETFLTELTRGESLESTVLRAAVRQQFGDLAGAAGELSARARRGAGSELGPFCLQRRIWMEMTGDVMGALGAARGAFQFDPSEENHRAYVEAMVAAAADGELLTHISQRSETLIAEAEFWRSLLPELRQSKAFIPVAEVLVRHWERATSGEAVARFALAELCVFRGRLAAARERFWQVFEMEELDAQSAAQYFQRLNRFFHDRYAVKYRLDEAGGRYGAASCRVFSFLGLRDDFGITEVPAARDAALLYLRQLETTPGESGAFLRRMLAALDRRPRPAGQRILAVAGAGAPQWLVDEVEAFIASDAENSAAAEFALRAMNRFIPSLAKFPDLRRRIEQCARELSRKLDAGPASQRDRIRSLQAHVLRRLGAEASDSGAENERGQRVEGIRQSVEAGDLADAERQFRAWQQRDPGASRDVLLYLADARVRASDFDAAAAALAEYLEPLFDERGGSDVRVAAFGLLTWPDDSLGVPVPYWDEGEIQSLEEVRVILSRNEGVRDSVHEHLKEREQNLPMAGRARSILVRVLLLWWTEEKEEAILAARQGAVELEEPVLSLLAAFLMGNERRFQEGRAMLDAVLPRAAERHAEVAAAGRRLAFAFAVAEGRGGEAAMRAGHLAEADTVGSAERVEIAAGLVRVGLADEAAEWLRGVRREELTPDVKESLDVTELRILTGRRHAERALGRARWILLDVLPQSFEELSRPARKEALGVLHAGGALANYEGELETLLAIFPRSLSLRLLLAEVAAFRALEFDDWEHRLDAARRFAEAVALRPVSADLQAEFAGWLADSGFYDKAAAHYLRTLELDASLVFLDLQSTLKPFQEAGRLDALLAVLDEWQVPESASLDDFYGLQPSVHVFEALGEAAQAQGDDDLAARFWRKCLEVNPLLFTSDVRVRLANYYSARGDRDRALDLLREYVKDEVHDPRLYFHQPFATVVPRWIISASEADDVQKTAFGRLLAAVEAIVGADNVRAAALEWRSHFPDSLSIAVFPVYLAERAGSTTWSEDLAAVERKFASDTGPGKIAWDAVERMFGRQLSDAGPADQ